MLEEMNDGTPISAPQEADISPAKARILAVAIDLFYENGYERTTVRDIAARAGILSGSLFHHFKTKQDILFTAMALTTRAMGRSAEAAIAGENNPRKKLYALILSELTYIRREGEQATYVLVDEWRSLDAVHRAAVLALRNESYERCWRDTLKHCADDGLLHTDPKIARQLIRGALAWTNNWYRSDGDMTLEDLCANIIETFTKSH